MRRLQCAVLLACGVLFSVQLHAEVEIDDATEMAEASRLVAQSRLRESLLELAEPQTRAQAQSRLPRFYKAGDRWVVAVSHLSHGFMRKTDSKLDEKALRLDPEYYEFRVVSSSKGLATVEIRPRALKPRVQRTLLLINDRLEILSKTSYRNGASAAVASQGPFLGNVVTGFNPVPLVLPDFARAEAMPMPGVGISTGRHPIDPRKTVRFKESDLFNREVLIDWQQGDVWPARVRTASSLSLLVEQELQK